VAEWRINMQISEKRIELIKEIFENDLLEEADENVLHMLLQEKISEDAIADNAKQLTVGQKAADGLAKFAGSWTFIIIFFSLLFAWILANTILLAKPFDVYPFILMNLLLSCLAAIQAPIIMMSQNRQEEKDRLRGKNDYKVNLKSEIIIEDLHFKLDMILENQAEMAARIASMEQLTEKN